MTDEERIRRLAFIVELRRLAPLFEKAGVSDCFAQAADEIERLAKDIEYWKMIANRAYIDPKPLAQSDAERLKSAETALLMASFTSASASDCAEVHFALYPQARNRERAQSDAEPVAINDAREQALSEIFVKGFEDGRAYELSAIAAAIGSNRFMDPPDGGDVSLAEQVCRMREALEKAEAHSDASAGLIEAADIAEALKSDAHLYTATEGGIEGFVTACYEIAEALRARATDRSGK